MIAQHLEDSEFRMPEASEKPVILVVDDEVEILKVLRKSLEDEYRILTASRAKDALNMLDDSIDVVISDQRMPEMTGSEFLRIVRERHPDIVRINMTGYSDMNALIESVNQGEIFRYISKPWDLQMLIETVQLAVKKHREQVSYHKLVEEHKSLTERHVEEMQRLNHTRDELERAMAEIRRLRGG